MASGSEMNCGTAAMWALMTAALGPQRLLAARGAEVRGLWAQRQGTQSREATPAGCKTLISLTCLPLCRRGEGPLVPRCQQTLCDTLRAKYGRDKCFKVQGMEPSLHLEPNGNNVLKSLEVAAGCMLITSNNVDSRPRSPFAHRHAKTRQVAVPDCTSMWLRTQQPCAHVQGGNGTFRSCHACFEIHHSASRRLHLP
jgi:hypothetical protein